MGTVFNRGTKDKPNGTSATGRTGGGSTSRRSSRPHRRAAMAGRTQEALVLEEAQASIRAARFAPKLTSIERLTLIRDAVERLHKAGLSVADVRNKLWIEEP
jgi:hypothetical protein